MNTPGSRYESGRRPNAATLDGRDYTIGPNRTAEQNTDGLVRMVADIPDPGVSQQGGITLQLPPGEIDIEPDAVQFVAKSGWRLQGAGRNGTHLNFQGDGAKGFEVLAGRWWEIADLWITAGTGTDQIDKVIAVDWPNAGAPDDPAGESVTSVLLRSIHIDGRSSIGLALGTEHGANQTDLIGVKNCVVSGGAAPSAGDPSYAKAFGDEWYAGIQSGEGPGPVVHGNTIGHFITEGGVSGFERGIQADGCDVHIEGVNFGGNGTDVVLQGAPGQNSIRHCRSELANRFLSSGGDAGATSVGSLTFVQDISFKTHRLGGSKFLAWWHGGGPLVWNGLWAPDLAGVTGARIALGKAGYDQPILGVFSNMSAHTAVEDFYYLGGAEPATVLRATHYTQLTGASNVPGTFTELFPVVSAGWTLTNVATNRTLDANATVLGDVRDFLGTLVQDLINRGYLDT